jgi:hypothetical protein
MYNLFVGGQTEDRERVLLIAEGLLTERRPEPAEGANRARSGDLRPS